MMTSNMTVSSFFTCGILLHSVFLKVDALRGTREFFETFRVDVTVDVSSGGVMFLGRHHLTALAEP